MNKYTLERLLKKIYGIEIFDYGLNILIKDYAKFPTYLPDPFYMEHGWTALTEPLASDLNTNKKMMLVFSKRRELAWKSKSKIPVFIMGSPFVHYRRMHKIESNPEAKGTIAFPAHSGTYVKPVYDVEKYCNQLNALGDDFKPISISLLSDDIIKGVDKKYIEYGFNIVSSGNRLDINFAKKFYGIIRNYKYATSNDVGSAAFYCIEMGIPFFVLGDIAIDDNDGRDMNIPKRNSILDHENGRIAFEMFNTGPIKYISDKQTKYVCSELGIEECLSPKELNRIFWKYFLYEVIKMFKILIKKIIRKILGMLLRPFNISPSLSKAKLYIFINGLNRENKIFTHMTINEKIMLHKILKSQNNKLICAEIGSYLGASSCFIANAISNNSLLYCIDTWSNDAMSEGKKDTFSIFMNNTNKYKNKVTPIRSWSYEAIDILKKKVAFLDLLFIDGDHHYESVKKDWDLYSPLLKPGSIVAVHDTEWAEGVKRVVRENVLPITSKVAFLPNLEIFKIN